MAGAGKTIEDVKAKIMLVHQASSSGEKIDLYDKWAENFEEEVALFEYSAPFQAADSVSAHFSGDRAAAVVLDVACGSGLVAKQLKRHGFGRFVGIDGSEGMLKLARETGLYQDLQRCMLGEEPLPVPCGAFDVTVIAGALSVGHAPAAVIRELCEATRQGGTVCMTSRCGAENLDYKSGLEREMKQMEEEGLWSCLGVRVVEEWERSVVEEDGDGYISGSVYLYQKL